MEYGEFGVLKKVTAAVLGMDPDEIKMEMAFLTDLGADSLDLYQILMGVQEESGIIIPTEELGQVITVADAVELMKRNGRNKG